MKHIEPKVMHTCKQIYGVFTKPLWWSSIEHEAWCQTFHNLQRIGLVEIVNRCPDVQQYGRDTYIQKRLSLFASQVLVCSLRVRVVLLCNAMHAWPQGNIPHFVPTFVFSALSSQPEQTINTNCKHCKTVRSIIIGEILEVISRALLYRKHFFFWPISC